MKFFKIHLHTLKNSYSQSIQLVLILICVITFVFCSIAFTITHSFVKRGHALLEQDLGVRVSWSGIYIHPWRNVSDISIFSIRFQDNKTQKNIVSAKKVFLDFEIRKYILHVFKTLNVNDTNVPRVLNPISYLSLFSIRQGMVNYSKSYKSFYENIRRRIFSLKRLPHNAIIVVDNSHLNISLKNYRISSSNVTFAARLIRATKSVTFDIGSMLTIQSKTPFIFSQQKEKIQIDLSSRIVTNNFFKNVNLETRVHSTSIGDILKLKPLTVASTIAPKRTDFSIRSEHETIAEGAFDHKKKIFTTQVNANKFSLNSFTTLSPKKKYIFSEFFDDSFLIQGNFLYNAQNPTMNYALRIQNSSYKTIFNDVNFVKQNRVNIQFQGNESLLQVQDITMNSGKNFFSWQGSLALKTMSPDGKINFAFEEFLKNTDLRGAFLLTRDKNIVRGKTEFLTINALSQPKLSFTYNAMKNSIHFFLDNNQVPNIILFKNNIINQWHITFNTLPLAIVEPFLPSVYKQYMNVVLDDVLIDGNIVLHYEDYRGIVNDAQYSIELATVKKTDFHARIAGLYIKGLWKIQDASLSIPTFYNTTIIAQGTYDSNTSQLEIMTRVKNSQHETALQYAFISNLVKKNNIPTWELSINKKSKFSIEGWGAAFTQKRIRMEVTSLLLPVGNLKVKDMSINAVYRKNIVKQLNGTIHVVKNDTKQFIKTKFLLIDEEIRIPSFHFVSFQKEINARGKITQKDGLWNVSLRRYSTKKKLKILDEEEGIDFINGTYDTHVKEFYMALRNIDTQLFFPQISGFVNIDFFMVSDLSRYEISLRESTITVNNTPNTVSGSMQYKDNIMSFHDVLVQRNALNFHISEVTIKDAKHVLGTYGISLDKNNNVVVEGTFDFNIREKLNYNALKKRIVPYYDAVITMNVYNTRDNEKQNIKDMNFVVTHTPTVFSITERKDILFVNKSKSGSFQAYIGGLEEYFYITVKGKVLKDLLDVHVSIEKANLKPLFEYFESFSDININTLELIGRLSVKGTLSSPKYYGFVEAIDTEFRTSVFSKKIIIPQMTMLLSEDSISITNVKVNIGSGRIDVAGKGRLVNYKVQDLNINMNIDEKNFVRIKKLSIGKINITGSVYGSMSIARATSSDTVEIDGYMYLSNTDVVFETRKKIKNKSLDNVSMDITLHSKRGVVFIMPSINFPVLQGYLASNQKLRFRYDGNIQNLVTEGTIKIQSGQVYYFNKGFIITESVIKFDEENPINSPYLLTLEAQRKEYYKNNQYTLQLTAESTKLLDMEVAITSTPSLSSSEIAYIIGNENQQLTNNVSPTKKSNNKQLLTGFVSLSDPLSNIGIFSRFEQLLRRSLKLDYIAFNTKIAQRILEYSFDREAAFRKGLQSSAFSDAVPYFFVGSSLEIGKYLKDLYVSFALKINNNALFTDTDNVYAAPTTGVNTVFNVELPTPVLNVRWSFDPTLLFNRIETLPVSFLSISYQLQY